MAPANAPRPWRALAVVGILLVGLYLAVGLTKETTPQLGLDLRGGTQVILTAETTGGGGKVTSSALATAVDIIRQRVNGIGVGNASVTTQGRNTIVVAVPGAGHDEVVNRVGQTAQLRFRQVLAQGAPGPTTQTPTTPQATPSASGSPQTSGTPKASTSAAPATTSSPRGRALSSDLLAAGSSASPTPSATPTPTPSASASPGATDKGNVVLPKDATPQQLYATINCADPNVREALGALDQPGKQIVACAQDGSAKYLLDKATVLGTMVKSADAVLGQQGWEVDLSFNGKGTSAWGKLTQKAYDAGSGNPENLVAIVLDGQVVSAPQIINPILGGQAQITGSFTQSQAQDLANVLKYGALPLKFTKSTATTVSPTLGSDQLHGGLIAGAIGLGLVLVYSFIYYRLLGMVVLFSLGLSGSLLYAATCLLGHSINYTLTLAGIAGFIVAIGITADSFVVYFERIKDELHEGRATSLRSAVERAWPRARRTILSADTVSILAAVILYLLSVGDVRGFAFTLGLSTLSDLFIVFFFTKPLMTVLVRTPLYRTPHRFSGLSIDRIGRTAQPPLRASRQPASKEA